MLENGRTPEPYDLLADRQRTLAALEGDPEVDRLAKSIDPGSMPSIMAFGQEPARAIGQTADDLLRGMGPGVPQDPGDLLERLAEVMNRVSLGTEAPRPGLLGRLFGSRGQGGDALAEYDALGADLDRAFVGLKAYGAQLERDNRRLEELFQANLKTFHTLEKYVVAGERARRALALRLATAESALNRAGEGTLSFEVQTLKSASAALERRVQDLKAAEAVALQCIPMIRALQINNRELCRKIDAAFLATLPAFRVQMARAVQERRERLKGEALNALRARTGELQPDAAMETARQSILAGIRETRALRDQAAARNAGEVEKLRRVRQSGRQAR